jgi:hypothetical protein
MYQNVIKESCWLIAHVIVAADFSQIQEIFEHKLVGHVIDFGKFDKPDTYTPRRLSGFYLRLLFVDPRRDSFIVTERCHSDIR